MNQPWQNRLQALSAFFQTAILPSEPIKLNSGVTIIDLKRFIKTNYETAKNNQGNVIFEPYLQRAEWVMEYLIKNQNG
tara:strand:- start:437 stop:670 length:234 start_codon:yes stop_codon:yes gene_type:complete